MQKALSIMKKSMNHDHDSINILSTCLYSKDYDILVDDVDFNNHSNQSTISRIVDDALMEYAIKNILI